MIRIVLLKNQKHKHTNANNTNKKITAANSTN